MLKSERERLRKVISEAVLLLCKNSCMVESLKVSIEGIIGITLGEEDVILVSFREESGTDTDAQIVQEQSSSSHELATVRKSDLDETGRRHLTRKSKDSAIRKIVTQAAESVETSETEEWSPNKTPAKRQRLESLSEENPNSKAGSQETAELGRSLLGEGPNAKKAASGKSLDNTVEPDSDVWVKREIPNTLCERLTESKEFSVEPSSLRNESTVVQETESGDSVASHIPKNQPDVTECDNALRSILKLPLELAGATPFGRSDSSFSVKREDRGIDDDCVFVKSEIFEETDNQTFDLTLSGGEEFFGEASVPFSESQPDIQDVAQLPSLRSRYMEYVQRGCVVQASTSQTVHAHVSEDPGSYAFGSGKHDASLECHICKTVLKSRQTLNDHIQGTHLSRYRYKCTFCGLGFKWRSMLSYHKRACPALSKPGLC